MFVKYYAPVFVTDVLYNWTSQFKISSTNVWRRNSFSKLLLKRFWQIIPRWPWPLTQWAPNQLGSSAAEDGCVDKVSRRYVKAFSSYWSETKRLQTDRQKDRHVQSNMPSLLRWGAYQFQFSVDLKTIFHFV